MAKEPKVESKDYNEDKQKLLLNVLLSSEDVFTRCANIIQTKYFVNKLRPAVRFMLKHADEYRVLPKIEQINAETGLDFAKIDDIGELHQEAFLDEIEEFCKNRALADAVLASADLIDKGNYGEVEKLVREAMKSMRGENVESLRRTLDTILDPAVASRFEQELPEPEPTAPAQRLPVRNGGEVLGQLLPSDFAAWAEIRIPTLADGNPDRIKPMRLLVSDAQERWNAEWKSSLERLQPMQKAVEEAMRSNVTLSEMQQRVRTAVAELDAARSRLQLIEDPVLNDAAALMDLPTHDPRVERLRLERAAEFAGLGWRDLPVQTMFQLDREATIDLPTVVDELGLSEGSRAIADMALVDSAVPLIETAEMLRQACVQSLRSLVLELKKAQLRGTDERGLMVAMRKVVTSSAASIDAAAQMRIELQRGLMEQTCDTLQPAEARALRRAYWQRAFPELFVERKPAQNAIERLIERMPPGGEARAAADAVLEAREGAIDSLLPAMIAARKKWPTDGMRVGRETFAQLEREAPILGTTLRVREEIDARALRSLASLHGDDPEAWRIVIEWGREHPGGYEGLPD